MLKKLNIGCGKLSRNGYVNMDIARLPGVDVVHDLNNYPWPFKENEFDEIYASHVLEHLDSIIDPLEEIWRVSKNGALIKIGVPIFPGVLAACDPTHKQFYTYMTFKYFEPSNTGLNYYSKAQFITKKRKIIFNRYIKFFEAINISKFTQKFYAAFFSFLFPATILEVELIVVK